MHNPKSVEFHKCHGVFYHNIEDNERNLYQDLLTAENTNSDLEIHALHYANELVLCVSLPFKTFCKFAQNAELFGKRVMTHSRC